ncbi:MAG: hypothetical protein KIH01_05875 [Candidatus Freyarchaeota archaeon]|nr:hypothetical protein [Candidatus Jordarchaeia archaeon]
MQGYRSILGAPYFIVIELNENGGISNVQAVSNESEHFGGTGRPPDRLLQFKPNAVITGVARARARCNGYCTAHASLI